MDNKHHYEMVVRMELEGGEAGLVSSRTELLWLKTSALTN
jgi:hypothetical protein